MYTNTHIDTHCIQQETVSHPHAAPLLFSHYCTMFNLLIFFHVCFSALSNALPPSTLLESLPTLILPPTQFQGHKAGPVAVYSLTLVPI